MPTKIVLVAVVLIALTAPGMAKPARPPLARACAVYDVHILRQLEDDGPNYAVTGFALSTAIALLVEARAACAQGEHERGLDLYSRIDLEVPPPLQPGSQLRGETQ